MVGSQGGQGVRRTARARGGPVVFATDLSAASRPAFRAALAWAGRCGGRLDVVHVLTPPSPFVVFEGMVAPTWQQLEARARHVAGKRMARLATVATRSGVRVHTHLSSGTPEEEVARFARRRQAELVVIGTHGRTGMGRAFMGSVAERIIRSAGCPVLTVRGPGRKS